MAILYYILGYVSLAVMAVRWGVVLFRNKQALRDADTVVVMSSPRAFGTLFATLDESRRLFAGKKIVFIYHLERQGHNPLLGSAFQDVTVVAVPRLRVDLSIAGRPMQLPPDDWHDPMSYWLTRKWVGLFGRATARVLSGFSVWRMLPLPGPAMEKMPRTDVLPIRRHNPFHDYSKSVEAYAGVGEVDVVNELFMYGAWNTIRGNVDAPVMSLTAEQQESVRKALRVVRGDKDAKLCGFHNRYGGMTDKTHRDGSPLEFYIPAIRELVDAGYQVLMQSDRLFHPRFRDSFNGMVVDADSLGIDKNIFRLFCGCHTDIFVGDWPVAPQMAASNGIPTLVVNAWPVGWAVNGAQVYYRGVRGADGKRWDAERTLRQGPLISCNTEAHAFPSLFENDRQLIEEIGQCDQIPLEEPEILDAVRCFLEDLETGAAPTLRQTELAAYMPIWSPFALGKDVRLNRAWVQRYANETATQQSIAS